MTLSQPLRILLWPASVLYGFAVRIRLRLYASGVLTQKRLKAAVISVGNLSVGGTGKTPFVIWLAEKLLDQGKRVAILTRGYRGTGDSSDEAELMRSRLQNRVPIGVGKDRFAQGQRLESKQGVDVFLLDDGFQHLQLARDADLVLMDASSEVGGEVSIDGTGPELSQSRAPLLLPAGPMREPLSSLNRSSALILTRVPAAACATAAVSRVRNLPVFTASTRLRGFQRFNETDSVFSRDDLGSGPFFAFCGIGNPKAFVRDLIRWSIVPVGRLFFSDHHKYSPRDAQMIERAAVEAGAKALITTEKDYWNLRNVQFSELSVYIVIIDLQVPGESQLLALVGAAIAARGARS
jgi:tetraacyldisaccharide 4'-kinase